jgi:hypothetical protein
MAFNHTGKWWLANGANMWVAWRNRPTGSGTKAGPIWVMAMPYPYDTFPTPSGTTQLEVLRSQVRFVYQNGGEDWAYYFLVENTRSPGWNPTWFGLSGGGN